MWCTRLPSSPGRWRRKYGSRKRQRQWARLIRRSAMRLSGSHKGLRCWPAPNRPRGSCRLDAGDGREDEQQAYSNNPESPQGCPGAYGPEHRCLLRGVALRHPSMAALSAPPRSPRFPKWDVAQRAPLSFSGIYTIAEHLCTARVLRRRRLATLVDYGPALRRGKPPALRFSATPRRGVYDWRESRFGMYSWPPTGRIVRPKGCV